MISYCSSFQAWAFRQVLWIFDHSSPSNISYDTFAMTLAAMTIRR